MARKSKSKSSRSKSSEKSNKTKYALRRSKLTGKPIGFSTFTMKKALDGHSYKSHKILADAKWPASYQGVSKATIMKNRDAHYKAQKAARASKKRSKSASRSRSASPKAKSVRKATRKSKSASKSQSKSARKSRSKSRSKSARKYKPITKAQAELAFNKWYKDRLKAGKFTSAKGMRQSMTYDLNHRSQVVKDSRYAKNPHKYDYPGVDVGSKKKRPVTGAALVAHKKKLRSKSRSKSRSKPRKSTRSKSKSKARKPTKKSTRSKSKSKSKARKPTKKSKSKSMSKSKSKSMSKSKGRKPTKKSTSKGRKARK